MTSIKVGNRRLLRLAAFLEKLPRERFNYAIWVGQDRNGRPDPCGTTACALGWATTMPEFRRLGLRLSSEMESPVDTRTGDSGAAAAMRIFSLTLVESQKLFVPNCSDSHVLGSNATAQQVARHIRQFVASRS